MQVTKFKHQQNQSNFFGDIGDLLFQRTYGMRGNTELKRHANTVASIDV